MSNKKLMPAFIVKSQNGSFVSHDQATVRLIPARYMKTAEKLFKDKNVFLDVTEKKYAATVTARYYKGVDAVGANIVIVAENEQENRN